MESVTHLDEPSMANLLIRNVDEALHARLKARAVEHRRSLEEEVRELLRTAVALHETASRENLVDLAQRLFGPEHGIDLDMRHLDRQSVGEYPTVSAGRSRGAMAQAGERYDGVAEVTGSIPVGSANNRESPAENG